MMTEPIRVITDDLAIAGQLALPQLMELVSQGFHAVLNLRSPEETGFLPEESDKASHLGLTYAHHPLPLGQLDPKQAEQIFAEINRLPKPLLMHCDNAVRSAAIALMYLSTRQGATLDAAWQQVHQVGLLSPESCRTGSAL